MDAVAARTATYQRHAPEQDLLYQILCEHLETFLQECRTEAHGLPAYVERDLRAYLECGVLYVQPEIMCSHRVEQRQPVAAYRTCFPRSRP